MFAVREDGSFLLTQRDKPGAGHGLWSLPGGHIERGESWQDAALRELAEETGLAAVEALLLTVTTTGKPLASDDELGWLVVWGMGRCKDARKVTLNSEASNYSWAKCGDLWRYDLWKPHWTPLLDYYGGTTNLDYQLKRIWNSTLGEPTWA